jgi:hypothetical protein
MTIDDIQLYNIIRAKLVETEAKSLVDFISSKIEKEFSYKKDVFLTKEDKIDIIRWRVVLILGQSALLITIMKLW